MEIFQNFEEFKKNICFYNALNQINSKRYFLKFQSMQKNFFLEYKKITKTIRGITKLYIFQKKMYFLMFNIKNLNV